METLSVGDLHFVMSQSALICVPKCSKLGVCAASQSPRLYQDSKAESPIKQATHTKQFCH